MAANGRRGEVAATIGGRDYRLCLTLGALAELEDAFGVEDLGALTQRFASGRLSARDITRVLGAGLRGGGAGLSDADVAGETMDGGLAGFAALAARLLEVTFGGAGDTPADPSRPQEAGNAPFPGTK